MKLRDNFGLIYLLFNYKMGEMEKGEKAMK